MIGKSQAPSSLPSTTPATPEADTSVALNQINVPSPTSGSDPDDVKATPTPKASGLDKYNAVAGAVSSAVQKGLSYANARREREKYRG
jgi:hypothetical protein